MERKKNVVIKSIIDAQGNVHIGDIINRYNTQTELLNLVIFAMRCSDLEQLHGQKIKDCHDKLQSDNPKNHDNYDRAFHNFKENDFCADLVRHHYGGCPSEWKPFCTPIHQTNSLNMEGLVKDIFHNRKINIQLIYIYNLQGWNELEQEMNDNQFESEKALFIFDSVSLLHKAYRTAFNEITKTCFGGVIALTYCNLPNDTQQYLRVVVRELAKQWHKGRKVPEQHFYLHLGDEYLFENLLLTTTSALGYNIATDQKPMTFNTDDRKSKTITGNAHRLASAKEINSFKTKQKAK